MPSSLTPTLHYSRLADDPDLGELIELFVAELPDRLAEMQGALDRGDYEKLRTLAHQLKGAGGSHGFDVLTPVARELEAAARASQTPEAASALNQLVAVSASIRAGKPA